VFDHATFRYRIDGPEMLHDVSFHVPAGVGLSDLV
jgi:ATP-binding cassette, subfamily B, bacterial HlyB/CyaB